MKVKMVYVIAALVLVFSLAAAIMLAMPVAAQGTIYVDVNDGGCVVGSGQPDPYAVVYCNIQDAIDDAIGGDTIIVAVGQYNEHDITINKSLVIQGAGSGSTIVDGQDLSRVFYINQSTVDMSGMTIRNGNTTSYGGGIYNYSGNLTMTDCTVSGNTAKFINDWSRGGGIYNYSGNLTMTDCAVSGNTAQSDIGCYGGGIYSEYGNVTMTNCTVSGNTAQGGDDGYGGGIHTYDGKLTMTDCTISTNMAEAYGGGIFNDGGDVTMTNSTVSGNTAQLDDGGGIFNEGTLTLTNCTISGNTAQGDDGGGILNDGTATLTNCTISGNTAGSDGGGIYNGDEPDDVELTCTIVYGNTATTGSGDNIYGPYTDSGGNIVDGPNPLLGPLQNNGGLTETHALTIFSPAIDGCTQCSVATDQRGVLRPVDGDVDGTADCDIGAYEYVPLPPSAIPTLSQWGMIGMAIILAAALVWSVRRRWVVSACKS